MVDRNQESRPTLQKPGFTALWLPPVSKTESWKSMGYDPYDYYDLGEFDQKSGKPTWFGSKSELLDVIQTAHTYGMQVHADLEFDASYYRGLMEKAWGEAAFVLHSAIHQVVGLKNYNLYTTRRLMTTKDLIEISSG